MKALRPTNLMVHEVVFGVFLATMTVRLALTAGTLNPQTLLFALLTGVAVALPIWAQSRASDRAERIRLWFYPLAFNVVFMALKTAVPLLGAARYDDALNRIDRAVLGETPSVWLQHWAHPALSEVLSAAYLAFFPNLALGIYRYLTGSLETARQFCGGLFTLYGIGFLGYSLVPAAGPWMAMSPAFPTPLAGGWITHLNDTIVRAGSNGVDVFPSLHCAVSAYILFSDRRHHPRRFLWMILPCVALWVSTLYLRYHYAIDVLCGFALAAIALRASRRPFPFAPTSTPVPR